MTSHVNPDHVPVYTATDVPRPSADELRARIPGWGADLDPADRPSYPKLVDREELTGAHWRFPDRMPEPRGGRERSIEHRFLTPVFGTAQPLHGVSGAVRRLAYGRFSEGRAAHWLLLIAADRIETTGAAVRSLATLRPDNPVTDTGIRAELRGGAGAARFDRRRADWRHHPLDPVIVAGPWIAAGGVAAVGVRKLVRAARAR